MKTVNPKYIVPFILASLARARRLISGIALLVMFLPSVSQLNENETVPELG